jgi:hypothetical protein
LSVLVQKKFLINFIITWRSSTGPGHQEQ